VGDDRRERPYRRVGNTAKCPACGWRMDPEAYRCPKCHIYFCFKCRTRVIQWEPQFQCADQACPQYGKLLCAACTVMVPEFRDVTRIEYDTVPNAPEQTIQIGNDIGWITTAIALSVGIGIWIAVSFWAAVVVAGVVGALIPKAVALAGITWFKRYEVLPATTKQVSREVTTNEQVAEHRCCILCRHPCKVLR